MRRLLHGILLVASLVGAVPAAAGQEQRPEPFPAEVVGAWFKAGAQIGWLGADRFGNREFRAGGEGKNGEVPAFLFGVWPAGAVAKLPQPPRAFGLILTGSKVTDAGLKELAGLKSLQSLAIGGTHVTDAGLKELAGLESLQTLDLGDTPVTDAGLKELAGFKSLQPPSLPHTPV